MLTSSWRSSIGRLATKPKAAMRCGNICGLCRRISGSGCRIERSLPRLFWDNKSMHRLLAVFALAASAARAEPITFYKHIAPIVYHSCAPCHRAGEPGPFPLLTYDEVRKHGQQIVSVVQRRYMPPWLPEKGYGNFQ